MPLKARLEDGAPFRLGELAGYIGYSREHVRKLANAGAIKVVRAPFPGAHRRVSCEEVARLAKELRLI